MSIDTTKYTAHKSPGKFEGETAATEYFYEQSLEGDGDTIYAEIPIADGPDDFIYDEDAPIATIFHLTSEEIEAFDLPITRRWFLLREDSQGFVYGTCHLSRENAEAKFRDWLGISS
jgi:hypothetical protein